MLVCWEWLGQYVDLENVDKDELALQFAMSGLNHEETKTVGQDTVIDLEVTSNRGDCLGHIGVAREASVLLDKGLCFSECKVTPSDVPCTDLLSVENEFTDGCPEYTARIIRGVKIGPSPDWLVRRLAAIGIDSVNNVVDVTNYVMFECCQPLHAFDLEQICGGKIIVRPAANGEKFEAINHKTYELDDQMVVIADAERSVALGGVMGGVDSEVSDATTDLLIEAARFTPLSIRRTSRKLKLQSPSSYRFERTPDPRGLDWASRRCCELILEIAGGKLCDGVVCDGIEADPPSDIKFRLNQIPRVLGIEIPIARCSEILTALGCQVSELASETLNVQAPSWRTDLTRECDLIEEIARIHGYDQIPEDAAVPIGVVSPRPKDIALGFARHTLSVYGIDEAMTPSVVGAASEMLGSFWCETEPLSVDIPLLKGCKLLRRSLIPSLLVSRYDNQTQSQDNAELYEVANVYLPSKDGSLPNEQSTLGVICEGNLRKMRGLIEDLVHQTVGPEPYLEWSRHDHQMLAEGSGLTIKIDGELAGYCGIASDALRKAHSLEAAVAVAELSVDCLLQKVKPVRTAGDISLFPAITRDLNFIVDESLTWDKLSQMCQSNAGEHYKEIEFQEIYRDENKDGANKKRVLLTLNFQSHDRTLTSEEVDKAVQKVINACEKEFGAKLLS